MWLLSIPTIEKSVNWEPLLLLKAPLGLLFFGVSKVWPLKTTKKKVRNWISWLQKVRLGAGRLTWRKENKKKMKRKKHTLCAKNESYWSCLKIFQLPVVLRWIYLSGHRALAYLSTYWTYFIRPIQILQTLLSWVCDRCIYYAAVIRAETVINLLSCWLIHCTGIFH